MTHLFILDSRCVLVGSPGTHGTASKPHLNLRFCTNLNKKGSDAIHHGLTCLCAGVAAGLQPKHILQEYYQNGATSGVFETCLAIHTPKTRALSYTNGQDTCPIIHQRSRHVPYHTPTVSTQDTCPIIHQRSLPNPSRTLVRERVPALGV